MRHLPSSSDADDGTHTAKLRNSSLGKQPATGFEDSVVGDSDRIQAVHAARTPKYDVFVSHAFSDSLAAHHFVKQLTEMYPRLSNTSSSRPPAVFVDKDEEGLSTTDLLNCVDASKTLVCLLSRTTLERGWCVLEIFQALTGKTKPKIVLCKLPDYNYEHAIAHLRQAWQDETTDVYQKIQEQDCFDPADVCFRVCDLIRKKVGSFPFNFNESSGHLAYEVSIIMNYIISCHFKTSP